MASHYERTEEAIEAELGGYYGKYLDVNLSSGVISDFSIPAHWMRLHLGGRGIAGRILLQELPKGAEPLGSENILVFATGPLQGTGIPGAGRHVVAGKSPKTRTVSDSYAGGFFGDALARTGYDGILLRGRSSHPVYLALIDGRAALHDARPLWGSLVLETDRELRQRHGDVRVSCIGPAGENLVRQACIINDVNRAAGRPGFGAVMGAKRLKAVAVGGEQTKAVFDPQAVTSLRARIAHQLMESPGREFISEFGTAGYLEIHNEKGIQPSKNFLDAFYDHAAEIGGHALKEILVRRDNCAGCPIRCKRVVQTEFKGQPVIPEYGGPEYETLAAFGTLCLNRDLRSIALANQRCNALGLDTISTGVSIAFAMEASEKHLLPERIEWGDSSAILDLIDAIAMRQGLGARLADGIDTFSRELGADFAMVIKGQEIPLHEPRGKKGLALTYATTPRGGQHMEGIHDDFLEQPPLTEELGISEPVSRFSWKNRAFLCKTYEDLTSFANSLVMCEFTAHKAGARYNYPLIREVVFAVTGIDLSADEMVRVGERNYNLLRLLSAIEGWRRSDDGLPARFEEPLPRGKSAGESIPKDLLEKYITEYYKVRGWSDWGPTKERLKALNLEELLDYVQGES